MMCISGPPCTPGKSARSRSFAYCSRHRIRPARGPRSVLCVVEVTKSACGTGLGWTPPATRPAMCAMSTTIGAPTACGDGGDAREVDHARVGAGADHDHLRLVLVGEPLQLLVVDPLVVLADAVGDDLVELAGEVQRVAVREVAAVGEVHAEHRVARLDSGEVDRHVGLRARVRLHVGVVGAEQLLWRARSPATRRRRRTRSRRSSACPDSPRRTCSSAPSRRLRESRWLTKFSDAISSSPSAWRVVSLRMARGDLGIGVGERALHARLRIERAAAMSAVNCDDVLAMKRRTVTLAHRCPASSSPRAASSACAAGHPWIYRADVVDVDADGGDIVAGASGRGSARSATRSSAIGRRSRSGC